MKKIIIPLALLLSFLTVIPAQAACPCNQADPEDTAFLDDEKELDFELETDLEQNPVKLYRQSAPNQATNRFTVRENILVKIETDCNGENETSVRVLNRNHQQILQVNVSRSGNGPFIYQGSFTAPATPGTYYFDVRISGLGSVCSYQQNLQIGNGNQDSNQTINSEVVAIAESGYDYHNETTSERQPVKPTVVLENDKQPLPVKTSQREDIKPSFFQRMINFFAGMLARMIKW